MKQIPENFSHIKKLIREIQDIINPATGENIPVMHQEFAWLMHKDNNIRFSKENPKCVFPLNIGRTVIFLPACNRAALQDKNIIALALKFVEKLSGQSEINIPRGEIEIIKSKLEDLMQNKEEVAKGIDGPVAQLVLDKIRKFNSAPPASEL